MNLNFWLTWTKCFTIMLLSTYPKLLASIASNTVLFICTSWWMLSTLLWLASIHIITITTHTQRVYILCITFPCTFMIILWIWCQCWRFQSWLQSLLQNKGTLKKFLNNYIYHVCLHKTSHQLKYTPWNFYRRQAAKCI